jgi:hypothetical protein
MKPVDWWLSSRRMGSSQLRFSSGDLFRWLKLLIIFFVDDLIVIFPTRQSLIPKPFRDERFLVFESDHANRDMTAAGVQRLGFGDWVHLPSRQ